MVFVLALMGGAVQAEEFSMDEVKAVYLLNFTNYIIWPEEEFSNPIEPFNYCLFNGDSLIREPLVEALQGEVVEQHNIQLKIISSIPTVKDCQVVYIDKQQGLHVSDILLELAGAAVLTVSDMTGFAEAGGGIELISKTGRVKLLINIKKVNEARLDVSSKLLRVADLINDADVGDEPW